MKKKGRVCAVIVTYNRKELLYRNISSLLTQEPLPDILIYDNCSPDMPGEYLKEQGLEIAEIDRSFVMSNVSAGQAAETLENAAGDSIKEAKSASHIYIYRADENSGGAGGFAGGMKMAYDMGYEFVWLMDDDGYCLNESTLKNILSCYKEKVSEYNGKLLLNSLVIGNPVEKGGDDTLSFLLDKRSRVSGEKFIEGDINPFNGTLVSRDMIDEIGVVKAELFIQGDETEYTERAKAAGYTVATAAISRYYHPSSADTYVKFFGRDIGLREFSGDGLYYYVRNYMYIMRKYRSLMAAILHIPKVIFKAFLYKEHRFKKLCITIKGLRDGFCTDTSKWKKVSK